MYSKGQKKIPTISPADRHRSKAVSSIYHLRNSKAKTGNARFDLNTFYLYHLQGQAVCLPSRTEEEQVFSCTFSMDHSRILAIHFADLA
jgi:hypothetical protein